MKKILITGGAGFIGANLVRRLISYPNFKIFIIERKNANLWRLKDVFKKVNIKYVDLECLDKLSKTVNRIKPNIVFHLASYGVYPSFQNNLEEMINTNVKGTLNLIDSLKNCPLTQFVNASTCFVYKGKETTLNENDPIDPLNFYSITKLTAELLLKKIAEKNNTPIINLRLFTPYGYYEDKKRLIPHIILKALKNEKIELNSPNSVRDFIFIEDLINILLKIIKSNHNYKGETFNIGSGEQHSVKEVVHTIEEILDKKLNVRYGKRNSHYKEPKFFQSDNKKAKKTFNWKIDYDFKSGILKTIDWFKENKNIKI